MQDDDDNAAGDDDDNDAGDDGDDDAEDDDAGDIMVTTVAMAMAMMATTLMDGDDAR